MTNTEKSNYNAPEIVINPPSDWDYLFYHCSFSDYTVEEFFKELNNGFIVGINWETKTIYSGLPF